MTEKPTNIQASTPAEMEHDFQQVHDIVVFHRAEVARKVNALKYQRKLIPRDILVKSLHDYCRFLDQATEGNIIDKK